MSPDTTKLRAGNWLGFAADNATDIAVVRQRIDRDDTGIDYEIRVSMRSLAAHAYEEGEDDISIWHRRVDFGQTDATCAGGYLFVEAAREQQKIADMVAIIMRQGGVL
jgi:hypothetical protein